MSTFEQYLGSEMINESRHSGLGEYGSRSNPSAILPATRALFDKNKVTPNHAHSKEANIWHQGDQHVQTYVHLSDKYDRKTGAHSVVKKHFHVAGYGHYNEKHNPKLGQTAHFMHDQTHNRMPEGHLVGITNYTDGKKVGHHGEDHSETKAPLHVYK